MTNTIKSKNKTGKYRKPTLRDIAKQANVSVATVSEILNNKPNNFCSRETKELVHKIAKTLNYKTNIGYKIMRGEKTKTIAIICSLDRLKQEEHIKELLLLLVDKFENNSYSVFIGSMTANVDENIKKIEELTNRGCSGFIFIGDPIGHFPIYSLLQNQDISFIGYSTSCEKNVKQNLIKANHTLLGHFKKTGKDNFRVVNYLPAMISPPWLSQNDFDTKHFLTVPQITTKSSENFMDNCFDFGKKYTKDLLKKTPEIDAILFYNDYLALGAAVSINKIGLEVGKDIMLAGINNCFAVKTSPFPISSAKHDMNSITDVIYDKIFDNKPFIKEIEMKVNLR
jgi:LacI family transcriptional regulator